MDDRRESGASRPGPLQPEDPAGEAREQQEIRHAGSRVFRVSRASLLYRFAFLVLLTLVGVLLLFLLVPMGLRTRDWLVLALLGFWALALLRYWVFLLSMPFRIRCDGEGMLSIESLLSATRVACGEVASLRVSPIYPSYLKIVTSRKKSLLLLNHIDGLHELVLRIKSANPGVTTRGC